MDGVFAKASTVRFLLRNRDPRAVTELLGRFWSSETRYLGLRRDLSVPFEAPAARVPISVRLLTAEDVPTLLDTTAAGLSEEELILRFWQRKIVEADIPTCYVAVTSDDTPCYMQWVISAEWVNRARRFYGPQFPPVQPGEALLEGAFTPAEFRGQRIMPCAMAQISERAADVGARWVITFVADYNVAALKGCERAGFRPYLVRHRHWRRFRRRFDVAPLPEGTLYPHESAALEPS